MKPGSVSSAERAPPPIVALASNTSTEHFARARVIAAARPFGPEPTTTASYSIGILKRIGIILLQLLVTAAGIWYVFHDPQKRAQIVDALRKADKTWLVARGRCY